MDQKPPPPPQPAKRLTLKINGLGTSSISATTHSAVTPGGSIPTTMSPSVMTPSGAPKIKLISRKSQPPTPADGVAPSSILPSLNPASATSIAASAPPKITKTKAGRQPKPSAKKRTNADSDDEVPLANGTSLQPRPKKPKITLKQPGAASATTPGTGKLPTLKVKTAGRIPTRPLGEGYDSEAEDREVDPVIEEQFLLRMMPGEHCDYLRQAVAERKIGISKQQGGADVAMKFLDDEGRRAMFVIQGQPYAAILLDLPTITEGMKTWDKKAMVKSADICQMMLVFAKVQNEDEARRAPLPKAVEHGHRWPHGITPPMHDARNRRFRKRLSKLEIQNKEAEVERLLAADKEALSSKAEFVDERQTMTINEESGEEYEYEEEDAEGEAEDYFGDADVEMQDNADLFEVDEALLEAEFMDAVETPGGPTDLATPAVATEAITPATANTGTPAAQTEESGAEADGADEEESGDEDDEEDGDDDDGDDGDDDDGDEDRHDEVAGVKIEIANLRKQLAQYEEQLAKSNMPMMRKRIEGNIKNIKSEIKLKQSAIGKTDDD
ncbi:transcription initiation factor TFIID subunit 7 [Podospora aff. communis PSN243]|uniref:Transcription initiation factor TFIID subunit 7 n=1 Tax=Podospora aff. communis PSN243 TaxID=3040156 RepID=A0AAV9H3G9_9PEZI|nr:transcription initiation factor TFIID subunit 7 [Podospora aff. communis PSN243]